MKKIPIKINYNKLLKENFKMKKEIKKLLFESSDSVLDSKLENLKNSMRDLSEYITDVSDEKTLDKFNEKYPFEKSFDELYLDVDKWIKSMSYKPMALSDEEYFDEFVKEYAPFTDDLGDVIDLNLYKEDVLSIMKEENKDLETTLKENGITYSV